MSSPTIVDQADPQVRLQQIEFHREAFLETDSDPKCQVHAHLALESLAHLMREQCGWALEYRAGLTRLWSEGVPVKDPEQVIGAARNSHFDDPRMARTFLANLMDVFGEGGGNLFSQLGQELAQLDWGVVGPLLTPVKTKQPKDRRIEWEFRLKALLHLEYLIGLNGFGSREDAIDSVQRAFGLQPDALIDWTKKSKHPKQISRLNLEYHQARARSEGERIRYMRSDGDDGAESGELGGHNLEEDGRAYQNWRAEKEAR